jgi:hypothetical protein
MKRANEIIGATLGMSVQEMNEARYQAGRQSCAVYTLGDSYWCCPAAGVAPPKGWNWVAHSDQFFAAREGRTIYRAEAAL